MIDLSQVPAPAVIEELNFETLLAERKAELIAAMPADMQADITATLALESEPLTILLEDNVYRELALRAHVNDSAKPPCWPTPQAPILTSAVRIWACCA